MAMGFWKPSTDGKSIFVATALPIPMSRLEAWYRMQTREDEYEYRQEAVSNQVLRHAQNQEPHRRTEPRRIRARVAPARRRGGRRHPRLQAVGSRDARAGAALLGNS